MTKKKVIKHKEETPKQAKVVKSKTIINTGQIKDKSDEFNTKLKKMMDEALQNAPITAMGRAESLSEILSIPPYRIITPKQVEHLLEDMEKMDLFLQSSTPPKKSFEDIKNAWGFYEELRLRLKEIKPKEIERFATSELFSYYSELLVLQAGMCGVLNQLGAEIENVKQKFEVSSRNDVCKKQGE